MKNKLYRDACDKIWEEYVAFVDSKADYISFLKGWEYAIEYIKTKKKKKTNKKA